MEIRLVVSEELIRAATPAALAAHLGEQAAAAAYNLIEVDANAE